jgi:molybdopterin/thiamine biosynthesis adenylyltransferase
LSIFLNIGTGTIFLEAFEDVILMGEKEGPANNAGDQ